MAKRCDRSSVNAEVHRLKNRVRQQRYRARKREEKAKRDGESETQLPTCLLITDSADVNNGLDVIHSNAECIGAENGTRSVAVEHGDNTFETHEDTESSQVRPYVKWQYEQPNNVELVPKDAEGNKRFSSEPYQAFHTHKIQSTSQMENWHGMNTLKTQDGSLMKPPDQREGRRSHEEILARRAKNRERQRGYRARKRLEADLKKAYHINQSTPGPVETQIKSGFMNRVPCHRDWKEEARRAHISKEPKLSQAEAPLSSLNSKNHVNPNTSPIENKEKQFLEEDKIKSEHQLSFNNTGVNETMHWRRDWKMAARNRAD